MAKVSALEQEVGASGDMGEVRDPGAGTRGLLIPPQVSRDYITFVRDQRNLADTVSTGGGVETALSPVPVPVPVTVPVVERDSSGHPRGHHWQSF